MTAEQPTAALLTAARSARCSGIHPSAHQDHQPVYILSAPTADGLALALRAARDQWPTCADWAPIGSDLPPLYGYPTNPPALRTLRDPQHLGNWHA